MSTPDQPGPDSDSGSVPNGAPPPSAPSNPYGVPPAPNQYQQVPSYQPHQPYQAQPPGQQPGRYPGYYQQHSRPGTIPLRPLGLSDLLEGIFSTLRRNPSAVLGVSALAAVAQGAIYLVAILVLFSTAGDVLVSVDSNNLTTADGFDIAATMITWGVLTMVAVTVSSTFFTLLSQSVLAIVASRSAVGIKTGLGQALRLMRGAWAKLFGMMALLLAVMLAFMGVLILLVVWAIASWEQPSFAAAVGAFFLLTFGAGIVSVWLTVKFCLAPSSLGIEQVGPFAALRRSWRLTTGSWWRTFGILLLVSLILGIVTSVVSTPLSMMTMLFVDQSAGEAEMLRQLGIVTAIQSGVSVFITMFGQCLVSLLFGLFYLDYRIRREGFDRTLVQLAEDAGANTDDRFSTRLNAQTLDGRTDEVVPGRGGTA